MHHFIEVISGLIKSPDSLDFNSFDKRYNTKMIKYLAPKMQSGFIGKLINVRRNFGRISDHDILTTVQGGPDTWGS